MRLQLSVIVPFFNEEASLPLLLARAAPVIRETFAGRAVDVKTHCKNTEHGTRTRAAEKWRAER
jgi:hypothetical protein